MKSSQMMMVALAAAASLALGASAYAQMGGGMGNGPGPGMGMGMMEPGQGMGRMHGQHGMADVNPAAQVEGRLAYLKTDLKITTAQESAWNGYAAKARQQAEGMQALRDKMHGGTGTAPELMAQRAEAMKQRAAGMEAMATALKDLYAVLTPEQKAVADKQFTMHHGPGPMASYGPRR
jgi:Spy/CpxP family protein refolding chaperone